MLKIYTDGSCIGNPGPGGWAFYILNNNGEIFFNSGGEKNTTNNKMELISVIKALYFVNEKKLEKKEIQIFTDSMYLKNGITEWIINWQKNNWKTASKKPVMNKELWIEILNLTKDVDIKWNWVRAHNGHKYNEIVDQMAREAALKI